MYLCSVLNKLKIFNFNTSLTIMVNYFIFFLFQTKLPRNIFPESAIIRHIQISQSNIEELHDDSLRPLKPHLESFSLVSARLKEIPQKAFKGLNKLITLDLEDNEITEIPSYTFYGLRLMKLSLKGNRLQSVSLHYTLCPKLMMHGKQRWQWF